MTQASQPKKIRISLAFRKLLGVALIARANTIVTQMTGNVNFTNLPFALSVLNAAIAAYLASLASALDGGKNAIATRDKDREVLVGLLRQLATYVEANCQNDLAIVTSSGFETAAGKRMAAQAAGKGIRTIDQGATGQQIVRIIAEPKAGSYELRYAALANGMPGAWTTLPLVSVKPVTINGLTPGTTYAFQVRSLTTAGFSEWGDSVTKMTT